MPLLARSLQPLWLRRWHLEEAFIIGTAKAPENAVKVYSQVEIQSDRVEGVVMRKCWIG
jgi:hypothetical protein